MNANRKQITAEQLFNEYFDRPAWFYSKTNEEHGVDPWIEITGTDKIVRVDNRYDVPVGHIILEYGRLREFVVEPSYNQIYVQE